MRAIKAVGNDIIALKEEQLKAVMDLEDNIYLSGRPGTGKSEAILYRIKNILNKGKCTEREILLIVSKNINEVRLRNKLKKIGLDSKCINIKTVKDFCIELIRKEGHGKIKVDSYWTYIDRVESKSILKEILLKEGNTIEVNKAVDTLYRGIESGNLKDKYIEKYNSYLLKNNLLDYNSVLKYAYKLIEDEDIAHLWRKKFKYISIHKLSEMSLEEYNIISKLFNESNNIMLVSDKLETNNYIYNRFKSEYKHKVIEFKTNHRVTKRLVQIENDFVKENWRSEDRLKSSASETGESTDIVKTKNLKTEAEFLVQDILKDKLSDRDLSHGIITSNSLYGEQLKLYLDKYSKGSLTFSIRDEINFLANKKITAMISYLKLVLNKHSDYDFMKVIEEFYPKVNLKEIKENKLGLNITDFIDGSTIKYNDPFARLYRYLDAENAVIIHSKSEKLINSEILVKLTAIKIDGAGNVLETINKEIFIGESASVNEAIKKSKEFLRFVSGYLIISHDALGTLSRINNLNEYLGIEKLKHKSYYDTMEICKRYYNLENYSLDNILEELDIEKNKLEVIDIYNLMLKINEEKIVKDKEDRVEFIENHIEEFYSIKSDLVKVRDVLRKKYVRPIDLLDKVIEVTNSPKINLFDWDNGYDYIKILKEFFMYFDLNSVNITEDLICILDKVNVWKKDSGEFISKDNIIPIVTLEEAVSFHFDNVYMVGVTKSNYDNVDKNKFYTGITRAKKNLKFIVPMEDVYGTLEEKSEYLSCFNKESISEYRY